MDNKILSLKEKFVSELDKIDNLADIENIRVSYLGKKGSVTDLLKGMKELSNDERKAFGQKVNELKGLVNEKISEKTQELKEKEIQKEIELMPEFDLSMPPKMDRGSYHPITLVQRECERIFKSMGFTVEDYSEIVTDYECFESLNIPKHHPARDMQDTYYLTNGQLLKSQTSAAQNAIYKKYRDALVNDGVPIKAIFPGRCFRNEATDACHENTFFQMEGVMVDKNISISNLIYFMKTMLSEVFQKDIKVRLRPGFFPFVEPGFELDISCLICGSTIYYGNMGDPYVICLRILSDENVKGLKVSGKVAIQLINTDPTITSPKEKIIKKSEKDGLFNALDLGAVWLERALKKQ
jgi:phenylalanyl-tRNA synthetase alpha chain